MNEKDSLKTKHVNNLGASRVEWMAALCLFVLFYIGKSHLTITFFIATLIIFFLHVRMQPGKVRIKFDGYLGYLLLFCLFCYASALWAENRSYSIHRGNRLLLILAIFIVFHLVFNDEKGIRGILKLIQWSGYLVLAYAVWKYGLRAFVDVFQNETRLSNDFINANTLGMCAAYSIVVNLYFLLYKKARPADILMLPAVVILAASGSRKALLALLAGVFAVFIFKNFNEKHIGRSLLRMILVIVILGAILLLLLQLPIFNGIMDRMADLFTLLRGEGSNTTSGWIRLQYNQLGWQLFKEHPIVGIGIDNARLYTSSLYGLDHYLHNNYAELAACGGIIGFGIYYSIYAYILFTMIRYCRERDQEWDICMILLMIWLVMDYGHVVYYSFETYVFLLLFWLEARKLKRESEGSYIEGAG